MASPGFTLVEVLIAFLVLALALGALLPAFSGGLKGLRSTEFYSAALGEVRSRMDLVGTELPVQEGSVSGTTMEGLRWEVLLDPFADFDEHKDSEVVPAAKPYTIEISVSDEDGRSLTIETLRLGPG